MHHPYSRKDRGGWFVDWPLGNPVHTDRVDAWEITPIELDRLLESGEPIVLVDVREDWEADLVSLPGSRHIPLGDLRHRALEELAEDDEVVLYCHHGQRSMEGVMVLWDLGYERVKSLAGGLSRWREQVDPTLPDY